MAPLVAAGDAIEAQPQGGPTSPVSSLVEQFCADCHNSDKKKGDLDLESISTEEVSAHSNAWERVVRRLRARQMPPPEKKRPEEGTYQTVLTRLESTLEAASAQHPNPGRTDTFRRLNRTEYQNAIRDGRLFPTHWSARLPLPY